MDAKEKEEILRIAPVMILSIPRMSFGLVGAYLRFKQTSKRAVRKFRRGLADSGIDPNVAELLAQEYAENARVLSRAGELFFNR
ncbi:MAG: hypothetical protein OEV21_01135 [Thermoplasmata archaeon]|nr:hypothetical protein [Thermoplasmata archaeon]